MSYRTKLVKNVEDDARRHHLFSLFATLFPEGRAVVPTRKLEGAFRRVVEATLGSEIAGQLTFCFVKQYGSAGLIVYGAKFGIPYEARMQISLGNEYQGSRCYKTGITLAVLEDMNQCYGRAARERMLQARAFLATDGPELHEAAVARVLEAEAEVMKHTIAAYPSAYNRIGA